MYPLTETQFQAEAEPLLRQIFVEDNPYQAPFPFSPAIAERLILYPCKCYIESISAKAITDAALSAGDEGCYIYVLGRSEKELPGCYVPLADFVAGYTSDDENDLITVKLSNEDSASRMANIYGSEIYIFSPKGTWGIRTTIEWFGLLGGSPEFVDVIRQCTPNLDHQVFSFLEHLRLLLVDCEIEPPDVTQNKWVSGLLSHVYGQERGNQILEEFMASPIGHWDCAMG